MARAILTDAERLAWECFADDPTPIRSRRSSRWPTARSTCSGGCPRRRHGLRPRSRWPPGTSTTPSCLTASRPRLGSSRSAGSWAERYRASPSGSAALKRAIAAAHSGPAPVTRSLWPTPRMTCSCLGSGAGVEQRLPVAERHDVVAVAVDDEQGRAQLAHAAQAGIGVGDHGGRDGRVVVARDVADARERRHQHQAGRRVLEREFERHAAAERLAEVDDARGSTSSRASSAARAARASRYVPASPGRPLLRP